MENKEHPYRSMTSQFNIHKVTFEQKYLMEWGGNWERSTTHLLVTKNDWFKLAETHLQAPFSFSARTCFGICM